MAPTCFLLYSQAQFLWGSSSQMKFNVELIISRRTPTTFTAIHHHSIVPFARTSFPDTSVPILQTISTSDAATALGVKPACIRLHLKAGKLSGVRIGRAWRIHLTSLNEILAGSRKLNEPSLVRMPIASGSIKSSTHAVHKDVDSLPALSSPIAEDDVLPAQNDHSARPRPVVLESPKSHQPPSTTTSAPKPLFDDNDMVWINRYRRDLSDPNPQVRADARWNLERFAQRAEQDPTRRVAARLTAEEAKAMAAALLASSPRGDRTWW